MDHQFSAELERRRAEVLAALKGGLLVLFAAPVQLRNGDVEQSYRQDSDFFYLTGFTEPESALVLSERSGFVLFVREKNREKETWEGRRAGVEGAVIEFGAREAHSFEQFRERICDYFEDQKCVHYLMGQEAAWDRSIIDAVNAVRSRRRKKVHPPEQLIDARVILHELRLKKSAFEQEKMAEVGQLSAEAHCSAMRLCKTGMMEWELQGIIESEFRKRGAERLAYDSIVGGGENGTILHYRENNQLLQEGDLVLIDAGAEKGYYAADITRTFPVAGKFSEIQARLYQGVLDAQLAAIDKTVIGNSINDVHEAAWGVLRQLLEVEGLIEAEDLKDEGRTKKRVDRFFMHRTSHYLGMDVHDVGPYYEGGSPRLLADGVVITVEPGLYFAIDDESVPSVFRGIGIRIEDDILVTEQGPVILTRAVPKTIVEVELLCQTGS